MVDWRTALVQMAIRPAGMSKLENFWILVRQMMIFPIFHVPGVRKWLLPARNQNLLLCGQIAN